MFNPFLCFVDFSFLENDFSFLAIYMDRGACLRRRDHRRRRHSGGRVKKRHPVITDEVPKRFLFHHFLGLFPIGEHLFQ